MTDAGNLRQRVTFSQREVTTDGFGGQLGDWQDQFTERAQVRPRLGGETVISARLAGTQPVTIRVRQSPATRRIAPDWRGVNAETGVVYNLRSIVDPHEGSPERGRWLDILAETGVEAG